MISVFEFGLSDFEVGYKYWFDEEFGLFVDLILILLQYSMV